MDSAGGEWMVSSTAAAQLHSLHTPLTTALCARPGTGVVEGGRGGPAQGFSEGAGRGCKPADLTRAEVEQLCQLYRW